MPIKTLLMPGIERLAPEVGCQRVRAANDFTLFHRQVRFGAAGISQYRVDLRAEREFEDFPDDIIRARRARAAAARRLLRLDDVSNCFERRVGAHVKDDRILGCRTDPMKLSKVELSLFAPDELLDVDAIVRQGQG